MIENGGHGGTAAAPAALKVFETYFHKHGIVTSHILRLSDCDDDRSRRPTRPRPAQPRPRDEALGVLGLARAGSTGSCSLRPSRRRRLRALGDRRDHAARSRAAAPPAGRRSTPAPASCCSSIATLIDPDLYRRFGRLIYVALVRRDGVRARLRRRDARIEAVDQPRLLHLPAVGVRQGRCSRSSSPASSPTARSSIDTLGVPLEAIGLAAVPILLVFAQPDVGTALVYIAVLAAVLFVSGMRWLHLALIGGGRAGRRRSAVLWWLPAAGVNVLKPYQAARLTGFTHPSNDPNDSTSYNLDAVDDRGRLGRAARPRRRRARRRRALDYLPAHDTDFAFASLAEQRGFFGASILLLLYLLVVWRGPQDRHRRARPLRRDRSPAGSSSRSSSRSSSTSA